MDAVNPYSLPSQSLARQQHEWLRGARSRLLRLANIARRKEVLEIGAGWGFASDELHERSGGLVTALDCDPRVASASNENVNRVVACAERLPFPDNSFDLVFTQFTLLWIKNLDAVADEMFRVLTTDGALALIEPDFGGLMEFPDEIAMRDVWIDALRRAGAEPIVGRKLPAMFQRRGLTIETLFAERLETADALRFELLRELPLNENELTRVREAALASRDPGVAHLPIWLIVGTKGGS